MKNFLKELMKKLHEITAYLVILFLLYVAFNFFVNPSTFSARTLKTVAEGNGLSGITKAVQESLTHLMGTAPTSSEDKKEKTRTAIMTNTIFRDIMGSYEVVLFSPDGTTTAPGAKNEAACAAHAVHEKENYRIQNPFYPANSMSYSAVWGDGTFSTDDVKTIDEGTFVFHTYTSAGTFTITFTVSNGLTAMTAERTVCVQ